MARDFGMGRRKASPQDTEEHRGKPRPTLTMERVQEENSDRQE
jgi:hypothetical protein